MASKLIHNFILISASFDDALQHANRLRRLLPPTYNPARERELPIPPVEITTPSEQSANHDESVQNYVVEVYEHGAFEEPEDYAVEDNEQDAFEEPEDNGHDADEQTQEQLDDGHNDVKPMFDTVELQQDDASAFGELSFGAVDEDDPLQSISSLSINAAQPAEEENEMNATANTFKYDEEVQYSYQTIADFIPIQMNDGYEIKAHDILSDNRPFKKNVGII